MDVNLIRYCVKKLNFFVDPLLDETIELEDVLTYQITVFKKSLVKERVDFNIYGGIERCCQKQKLYFLHKVYVN